MIAGRRAPRKKIPASPAVWKVSLGLSGERGVRDRHRAGPVVGDEEDRPAALVGVVVAEGAAPHRQRHRVAVVVDRAAAAAAGRARPRRIRASADGAVVGEAAVEHRPRDPDAAQRGAVGAHVRDEAAAHHVHRPAVVLGQGADAGPAQVGPRRIAAVAREGRVDDAQLPAPVEDRAAAAAVEVLAGRVAVARSAMFWTVSRGVAWSWQCEVVHTCAWSQVSM